jgi:site-specific DNA-methyltransferase (adenine-specific)
MTETPTLEARHADLRLELPLIPKSSFDLILADPPYGIDAGSAGFRARTVHHHNYEDDPETARRIARAILTEGFRIAKPRANLFIFCAIEYFDWLKQTAANMGWQPFNRPLIWQKSESEGLAPWGAQGPRITTEFILYATKGQRGLVASPIDVFRIKRVPRTERVHAAEKPVELLRALIECSTLPGEAVLDPCCGSGSSLVACREAKRIGLGIEKDETYFNIALSNVHDFGNTPGASSAGPNKTTA